MTTLPRIALTLGDPAGIGPEIVHACLEDERVRRVARLVGIGPARWAPPGVDCLRTHEAWAAHEKGAAWLVATRPQQEEHVPVGRASAAGGRVALGALRDGHDLASSGGVDALVTAPVSKEGLHAAGERVEGQTELLARWDGVDDYEMLAIAGDLRVMLLTRHLPLRDALAAVTRERVVHHLGLLERAIRELGFRRPRLALAGLNPHAGENGILGSEEGDELVPAVRDAREAGLDVTGPVSPDAVFASALGGEFDGVLALYHDQAFIPIKLAGKGRALTSIAGLSYLRVSPAHGTAFDIAGTGQASAENLVAAIEWAAERVRYRNRE